MWRVTPVLLEKKTLCHVLIKRATLCPFYGGSKAKCEDCRLLPRGNAHHGEMVQEILDTNGIRKSMNYWIYIVKIE
jgi:hypothetical protein